MAPKRNIAKKAKDPNAPKRPLSAYFLWLGENRPRLSQPGLRVSDVSKLAGVEWGKMTDGDKAKWQKKAAEDKVRYEREVAQYNAGAH